MTNRFVFIERDGGLLEPEGGLLERDGGLLEPDGVRGAFGIRLQPGCIGALAAFRGAGFGLVLLIDRPARAAGGQDEKNEKDGEDSERARQAFVSALFASQGIRFDAVERCGHEAGADCDCALPGIGLVAGYIADAGLDRAGSIVVGRREHAAALARAMGLTGFDPAAEGGWQEIAHTVLERPRRASVTRKTRETDIRVEVDLDRAKAPEISTGIGFFDHMLEQLGKHGGFSLRVRCAGDLEVDEHHTVEDVALAIGQALREALGDKRGIGRYGYLLPMDEAEARVAIDLSGRAYSVFEGDFGRDSVGGLPTELVGHFFRSLAESLGAAVHVSVSGENAHHMVEACFKGVARSLRQALARQGSDLPSTKGTL